MFIGFSNEFPQKNSPVIVITSYSIHYTKLYDKRRMIQAAVQTGDNGEIEVYCHSSAKEIKEQGIKTRFEKRFEDALTA